MSTKKTRAKAGPSDSQWQLGSPGRRAGEWDTHLMLLSNRLTRYAFVGQSPIDTEYRRLRLAEVRMADVVFAASAIESSVLRIREITNGLAATPVWRRIQGTDVFTGTRTFLKPRFTRLVARIPDAYYDFHAMLWWGRSLLHRIEGGWGERIKGEWVDHPIGLVEFLPKPDAKNVRKSRDQLLRGAFADVRDLADYSLHAFAVPRPVAMMSLQGDGTYALPLPDRLGRRPKIGESFTFNEHRHVGSEAESLWGGVEAFIFETFGILETAQLRREDALPEEKQRFIKALRSDLMPPPWAAET